MDCCYDGMEMLSRRLHIYSVILLVSLVAAAGVARSAVACAAGSTPRPMRCCPMTMTGHRGHGGAARASREMPMASCAPSAQCGATYCRLRTFAQALKPAFPETRAVNFHSPLLSVAHRLAAAQRVATPPRAWPPEATVAAAGRQSYLATGRLRL